MRQLSLLCNIATKTRILPTTEVQCDEKFNVVLESHFPFPVIETKIVTSKKDNILREIAMANFFLNNKV